MTTVPKLHHYLPEAYLRRFTDANGDLWVLDRREAQIRSQRPEVTAAERELYTLDSPEGLDRTVEHALAQHVDGPGLGVISRLSAGAELTPADREPLAIFVAGQYLRTPYFREHHRLLAEQMRESLREMGVEPAEEFDDCDTSLAPGAIRADVLLKGIEEARGTRRPYQNDFVAMMVSLLPEIAQTLMTMEWVIAHAPPKKSFVTSDAPVVITRPYGHSPLRGVGLATPGAEKVIPLTSEIALLIWDVTNKPSLQSGVIDPARVRGLNEMIVRQSRRFSMARSAALLRSIQHHARLDTTPPPIVEIGGRTD